MLFSFPEKLYVGYQGTSRDVSNPPLAFAVPYGTDAAFLKRKETVDSWSKNEYWQKNPSIPPPITPDILDNVPLEGYFFDRAVERYATSNKVFRITDPRGFQLEIQADNLADILLNGEVSRGMLMGHYIWARSGQHNFLMRDTHPAYILSIVNRLLLVL